MFIYGDPWYADELSPDGSLVNRTELQSTPILITIITNDDVGSYLSYQVGLLKKSFERKMITIFKGDSELSEYFYVELDILKKDLNNRAEFSQEILWLNMSSNTFGTSVRL